MELGFGSSLRRNRPEQDRDSVSKVGMGRSIFISCYLALLPTEYNEHSMDLLSEQKNSRWWCRIMCLVKIL